LLRARWPGTSHPTWCSLSILSQLLPVAAAPLMVPQQVPVQPQLSILSQLLRSASTRCWRTRSCFQFFPSCFLLQHRCELAQLLRLALLSILSQLLPARRGRASAPPLGSFQFFPSCFVVVDLRKREVRIPCIFQFFPSCFP